MDIESDSDCVQVDAPKIISLNSLSAKSRHLYESAYNGFVEWKEQNKITSLSEDVLMTYFEEIKSKLKPTTLYTYYSMLKTTLSINDNVDLDNYTKLKNFLKEQSRGYQPKKSKTLTSSQVEKFIKEAPDMEYLMSKVGLIMLVPGACRKHELYHMKMSDIEDLGNAVIITVPNSDTKESRKFMLTGHFYNIFKKYANLRPPNTHDPYFFLGYMRGKCANQRMGINKFSTLGKQVAKFLKLPNAEMYVGHCFRRTSAKAEEDAASLKERACWKSTLVSDELVRNHFGRGSGMLNLTDNTNPASTSRMESDDFSKTLPIESVTLQESDVPSMKASVL